MKTADEQYLLPDTSPAGRLRWRLQQFSSHAVVYDAATLMPVRSDDRPELTVILQPGNLDLAILRRWGELVLKIICSTHVVMPQSVAAPASTPK
jgi:hypothetical protein